MSMVSSTCRAKGGRRGATWASASAEVGGVPIGGMTETNNLVPNYPSVVATCCHEASE